MRGISVDELKSVELEMLKFIDKVCKKEGLRYFLCGGTLLGAVRHQGFIPWDDDIDIFMPRPDYEKLIELTKDSKEYRLLSEVDDGYYYNFGKLVDKRTLLVEQQVNPIDGMGIYIDIFPVDGMPETPTECDTHFRELDKIRNKINGFSQEKPILRKNLIAYLNSWNLYIGNKKRNLSKEQSEYKVLALQYAYDDSSNVYATGGSYKKKDIFPKEWLSDGTELEFEGKKFCAPSQYDKYLKQLYGDYMKLPPKEKQITHHMFKAYWKD